MSTKAASEQENGTRSQRSHGCGVQSSADVPLLSRHTVQHVVILGDTSIQFGVDA
jgi:hypothetical protein